MYRVVAVSALVLSSLFAMPTSIASHMAGATGNTGCEGGNMADNKDHYIWLHSSVGPAMENQIMWNRTENLNPTTIDTHTTVPPPDYRTDVEVFQDSYTGSICGRPWYTLSGATICWSLTASNRCQQHAIYYNSPEVAGFTTHGRRWAACHEFGHTLGLGHVGNTNSCMYENNFGSATYSDHDRDMFFNYY